MNQPITRQQHGIIEFIFIPLVAAAPALADFTNEKTAAPLARVLSGGILTASLLTRAEWGLVRVIPYRVHLATDTVVGLLTMTAPWLFGFARNVRARNTFLAIGVSAALAGMLSERGEMPAYQ